MAHEQAGESAPRPVTLLFEYFPEKSLGLLFRRLFPISQILIRQALADHLVNHAPIRKATQVSIIDKDIRLQLTAEMIVPVLLLFRIIAVHRIKFQSSFPTKGQRLVQ